TLIELAHDEAWEILVEYRDVLDAIVLELFEKETISQADMARLCARVVKRPPMAPYNGFGKRQPSDQPPVLTTAEKDNLKAQAEADGVEALSGGSPRPTCSPPRSRPTTRSWCSSGTSRCSVSASTTCCRSTAPRISGISPARTGGSPACPSSPGWSTSTRAGLRCRSGSRRRSQ